MKPTDTIIQYMQGAKLTAFKKEIKNIKTTDLEKSNQVEGFNFVHYCAYEPNGVPFLIEALKHHHLNLETPSKDSDFKGHTPLMIACAFAHFQMADLLLANGANPNAKYKNKDCKKIIKQFFEQKEVEQFQKLVDKHKPKKKHKI